MFISKQNKVWTCRSALLKRSTLLFISIRNMFVYCTKWHIFMPGSCLLLPPGVSGVRLHLAVDSTGITQIPTVRTSIPLELVVCSTWASCVTVSCFHVSNKLDLLWKLNPFSFTLEVKLTYSGIQMISQLPTNVCYK